MDIACTMAMTRAEFAVATRLPQQLAWMACHFSTAGDGLSNLPEALPAGSVIMIDDSLPPAGHDPERIATQLAPLLSQGASNVLLDFQRPGLAENRQIARFLAEKLPCGVCVTPGYADNLDCPVLVPPPALHQHLEDHLAHWKGRQLWLEATLELERITVTEKGSSVATDAFTPLEEKHFTDAALCCRYQIHTCEDRVIFTLVRDREMLQTLLKKAAGLGIHRAVGFYQQLGCSL